MRKALGLLQRACLALLACLALSSPAPADERILSYDVAAALAADAELTVTETIRVRSEGRRIRRGITRSYPVRQIDDQGVLHEYSFDIVSVKCDGNPSPYRRSDAPMVAGMAVGSADKLLPPGEHVYEIVFRTRGHVKEVDGESQIFYNALGLDNAFPVDRATFSLKLPDGVRATRTAAYTGREGEKGADWKQTGETSFATTRVMPPRHAFSVAVAFPREAVAAKPTLRERLSGHRGWFFVFSALVTCALLLRGWLTQWRRPAGFVVTPLFSPPPGWSAGEAARFMDKPLETVVLADVLYAAVKGACRIVYEGKDKAPFLVSESGGQPPEDAAAIASALLRGAEKVQMSGMAFGKSAEDRYSACGDKARGYMSSTGGWMPLIAFLAGYALFAAALLALWHPACDNDFGPGTLLVVQTVITAALVFFLVLLWGTWASFRRQWLVLILALPMVLMLVFGAAGAYLIAFDAEPVSLASFAVIWLAPAWFFFRMKRYPPQGWKLLAQLLGLKMYMETAEKERLARINAPEDTVERYEQLLPFAVALGCADAWEERFAGILEKADYRPAWIIGAGSFTGAGNALRASQLRGITKAVSAAEAARSAARSASRSSTRRSSGGGFRSSSGSGRGSGGGGVGGW